MIAKAIIILLVSLGGAAFVGGLLFLLDHVVDDSEYWEDDGK